MKHRINTEGRYCNPALLKHRKGRKLTSERPNKLTSERADERANLSPDPIRLAH